MKHDIDLLLHVMHGLGNQLSCLATDDASGANLKSVKNSIGVRTPSASELFNSELRSTLVKLPKLNVLEWQYLVSQNDTAGQNCEISRFHNNWAGIQIISHP